MEKNPAPFRMPEKVFFHTGKKKSGIFKWCRIFVHQQYDADPLNKTYYITSRGVASGKPPTQLRPFANVILVIFCSLRMLITF